MPIAISHAGRTDLPAPSAIDFRHLDRQTMGDRELAHELMALYYDQAPGLLEIIVSANDGRVLREAAHRLSGAASAIGAIHVADAAGELELNLMKRDFKRGFYGEGDMISQIGRAVHEVQGLLSAYLGLDI
jgi:HPt (histidine-containing phosphotransfer) domain-containing protein